MNQVTEQIESHIPALMRYARSLAYNPVVAEDLVQDCVVRALTKAHLYKPGTNLRAWLFTILHNLHVSEVRRKGKWKELANPNPSMASLSVPPRQAQAVMLRAVRRAMRDLPRQQKLILYLVAVEGKSYEEVSRHLDIPVGTVKSRCFRARETLHRSLSGDRPDDTPLSLVA